MAEAFGMAAADGLPFSPGDLGHSGGLVLWILVDLHGIPFMANRYRRSLHKSRRVPTLLCDLLRSALRFIAYNRVAHRARLPARIVWSSSSWVAWSWMELEGALPASLSLMGLRSMHSNHAPPCTPCAVCAIDCSDMILTRLQQLFFSLFSIYFFHVEDEGSKLLSISYRSD
ncbi:unnamed protein product [Amoebophrya sp. A25]|nr:unnamed protein product [Amoebophrya sp. A25]|eukprot:GSA25T00011103001.1